MVRVRVRVRVRARVRVRVKVKFKGRLTLTLPLTLTYALLEILPPRCGVGGAARSIEGPQRRVCTVG